MSNYLECYSHDLCQDLSLSLHCSSFVQFGRQRFVPLPTFYCSLLWSSDSFGGESIRSNAGTPNCISCMCNLYWVSPFSPLFRSTNCSVDSRKFCVAFDEHSDWQTRSVESVCGGCGKDKMDKNKTISITDNSNNNNKTHYYILECEGNQC